MPANPPIPVNMTDDMEKSPDPQRLGRKPPIDEPISIKTQMIDFVFTYLVYNIRFSGL